MNKLNLSGIQTKNEQPLNIVDIISAELIVSQTYIKDIKFAQHILANVDQLIKQQQEQRLQISAILKANEPKLQTLRANNLTLKFKMYNLIESFKHLDIPVHSTAQNQNLLLLRDTKLKIDNLVKKLHLKIARLQYKRYIEAQQKNQPTKTKQIPITKQPPKKSWCQQMKEMERIRSYSLKSHKLLEELLELLKH